MMPLPPSDCVSNAPDDCPDCGEPWSHGEFLYTGDAAAVNGYEDWRFCSKCRCELFYPVLPTAAAA